MDPVREVDGPSVDEECDKEVHDHEIGEIPNACEIIVLDGTNQTDL